MLAIMTFSCFLALFILIGIASYFVRSPSTTDYLLAGRSVKPTIMALSMVSSCNSGWMFIGLVGAIYSQGLTAIWMMVGWIVGDWLTWITTYQKLRRRSEIIDAKTIAGYIADTTTIMGKLLRALISLLILIFIGIYAAAQLKAGAKALFIMFHWPMIWGILLGAIIVLLYCLAGGIRASIWTDAVQAMVMFIAILLLCGYAIAEIGGITVVFSKLHEISPALLSVTNQHLPFGFALFFLGWLFAGIGVIGQPHIIIRVFTIHQVTALKLAAWVYYSWYILFTLLCITVGLCARVLLPALGDPELALPMLSNHLLPPVLLGLILAGLFSATISTADSQVLTCSACLSQDLLVRFKNSYIITKICTLITIIVITTIALSSHHSVFNLVVMAWSLLAACLAPLMVIKTFDNTICDWQSLLVLLSGSIAACYWRYALDFSSAIYEVLPGMLTGFIVYLSICHLYPAFKRSRFSTRFL